MSKNDVVYEDQEMKPLSEAPKWWLGRQPRFEAFAPGAVFENPNDEIALVRCTCQRCNAPFTVAITHSVPGLTLNKIDDSRIDASIANFEHLGLNDAPFHNDGCAGYVMGLNGHEVVEYWRRSGSSWERDRRYEVPLDF